MATKVSAVIILARDSINDPNARRFTPTTSLRVYNRTMKRLYTERPDIFVSTAAGNSLLTPPVDKVLTDDVPYEDQFCQLHADIIAAEFETMPDEDMNATRAQMFDARARR